MSILKSLMACVLAVGLTGSVACTDQDDADYAEQIDGSDDSKSDGPNFALTPVDVDSPPNGGAAGVGVIKSKTAWKNVFGTTAPSSIDFTKEWVAFYSAGRQSSGGYTAEIARVRLSDTGKTLKIATRLEAPGADCITLTVITTPYAVVKFAKPSPAPSTNRYTNERETYSCSDSCSGTEVTTDNFFPSTDGMECHQTKEHCVTSNHSACPQFEPLPPSFCPNGRIVAGEPTFITSADGLECQLPSAHCVTNDNTACPQISPLPPTYCSEGTRMAGAPRFISSADGMECQLPSMHCVTNNAAACPI